MRIGKKPNRSRFWRKAGGSGKPKNISPEIVIGQISPDLVSTVYGPKIKEIAAQVLEQYANEFIVYEDEVKELENKAAASRNLSSSDLENEVDPKEEETAEAEVDMDGTATIESDPLVDLPPPPKVPLFHAQYVIDEMDELFTETSNYFFAKEAAWKAQVNSNKFERLMEEKYGVFLPFIKEHPQVEEGIRSLQRKYASGYFSPFRQKDPPIPKSTAVIILFMMQRGKVRWEVMALTGIFLLIGLQPWALVLIVGVFQMLVGMRKNKPIGKMPKTIKAVESYYEGCSTKEEKHKKLLHPVGTPSESVLKELIPGDVDTSLFDTIIVGSGPSALYTGALLSRAGRKILLLAPGTDGSGCLVLDDSKNKLDPKYKNIPFDVHASNISKLSGQIQFLAPALSTQTDLQGGVRFAQVGTDADDHTFEILEIPGLGPNGSSYMTSLSAGNVKEALMDEAATNLGDGWPNPDGGNGNSAIGAYIDACEQINGTANVFYISKVIPESVNKSRDETTYGECSMKYTSGMLNQSFPLNTQTRSLVAAIGMRAENVRPNKTSLGAHITHLSAAVSGEGMYYPVGGPRALCHALANVIERNGGRVITNAPVKELIFDKASVPEPPKTSTESKESEESKEEEIACPRCIGVQLVDGQSIKFSSAQSNGEKDDGPVVISTTGLIDTFIRMLPDDIRVKYRVPRGLPALSESRPMFKAVFLLDGSASDLNLSGAEYTRLPNAAKPYDEVNQQTGEIKFGEIGWPNTVSEESTQTSEENIVEATNQEDDGKDRTSGEDRKRRKARGFKFESGRSWINIAFPSAKDPSFEERHGKVSTCVVTFEADDDFVTSFDSKPKLYAVKQTVNDKVAKDRLLQRVKRDLFDLYPQLEEKILHAEIPSSVLRSLMHNPERYAAKGVRADTPYPGLYLGGSDLTVSGSLSASIVAGWLSANAVTGYSYIDLMFLEKTLTTDIEQFLEVPDLSGDYEEDLAVPFTPLEPVESPADSPSAENPDVIEAME